MKDSNIEKHYNKNLSRSMRMKVWLDILTPKQLFYFTSIAKILKKAGWEVFLSARRYDELDNLIREFFRDWEIEIVGRFGGYSLDEKLKASIERLGLLINSVPLKEIELVASSGSIEACRIAYGLQIPHILASDSPHSPVNPLTAPISKLVITPWIIDRSEWTKYGVKSSKIKKYRVLDPCFWLKDFKPDKTILENLGVDSEYVLIRLPESAASYLRIDDNEYVKMITRLLDVARRHEFKVLVMARYREQIEVVENILKNKNAILIDKPVIGSNIIYYSKVFVGGGGTMTQEAALLGRPCISIYPGQQPSIHNFLSRIGLIRHCSKIEDSFKLLERFLKDIDRVSKTVYEKSRRFWKAMEDPEEKILRWFKEAVSK
ncbi:MAG: DUF354 domain-containing protein [Nitrososphaerota archaeon]|nr:DUF354 domain-containing protein [Nitrososphaerota archaeon]